MAKVTFRGKDRHHVTVGKGKTYQFQDPQSAWDWIGDSAAENPYVISLDDGIFEQGSATVGDPAWWFNDKTDISIYGNRGAILRKTGTTGGGTVAIGNDGAAAVRVRLEGFTMVNNLSGHASEGGPPEGGLYIGKEGNHPNTLPYDDIEVVNCHILGSHDGLQIFGTNSEGDGGPNLPPRVWIRDNLIESAHDVYTIKGSLQLHSLSNQINAMSAGIAPYITSITAWKTTGIHYNMDRAGTTAPRGRCFYDHQNEQIYVESDGNIASGFPDLQSVVAGIYVYSTGAQYPQLHFDNCKIRMVHLPNSDIPHGLVGLSVNCLTDITEGDLEFNNGNIDVHQQNTGASSPVVAAGVQLWDTVPISSTVRVHNTRIRARNDYGSGNAYSMQTTAANQTIKHSGIITDEAVDTSGGGTISYVEPLGHV